MLVLLALGVWASVGHAQGAPRALDDPRVIAGEPQRDKKGRIKRSRAVLEQFVRIWPCPSTGKASVTCPGWAIDHVIPLVCGGADAIHNLQWLPDEIKSARGPHPKDRWERRVYCKPTHAVK